MKGKKFRRRLLFALSGTRAAFLNEASFRFQCLGALFAVGFLLWLRPEPFWWALFGLNIAAVLAAELINTSIENILDKLHPETHDNIRVAKDCAAAAVLLLSLSSLVTFAACLFETY